MTPFVEIRPCSHAAHRTSRLQLLGCALTGFAVLAVWNPVDHPGPKCCLLRYAVGLPCPLCGMTRGMALCERGMFLDATWYNPLAVPLFAVALVLCGKWAFEYARRRSVVVALRPAWSRLLWGGVYIAVFAAWVYLLVYRREDDFAGTVLWQMMRFWSG